MSMTKAQARTEASKHYNPGTSKYNILVELMTSKSALDGDTLAARVGVDRVANRLWEITKETGTEIKRTRAQVFGGEPVTLYSF